MKARQPVTTLRSMTGFGQAGGENERLRLSVALRTVNHRHLDLVLRLPDELRPLEPEIRRALRRELRRGRVDLRVDLSYLGERASRVEVARQAVAHLGRAARELADAGLTSGELSFGDLVRLPEVLRLDFEPYRWRDEDTALLLEVVGQAVAQVSAARQAEGGRLRDALSTQLDELQAAAAGIAERRPEAAAALEAGFRQRLAELTAGTGLSEERLTQEVAVLAERTDVQEELDRLAAHVEHARELLADADAVGRRLEFLSQEMLRELNTLGAKSRDLPIIRQVLDAKAACERLREQVQNVE